MCWSSFISIRFPWSVAKRSCSFSFSFFSPPSDKRRIDRPPGGPGEDVSTLAAAACQDLGARCGRLQQQLSSAQQQSGADQVRCPLLLLYASVRTVRHDLELLLCYCDALSPSVKAKIAQLTSRLRELDNSSATNNQTAAQLERELSRVRDSNTTLQSRLDTQTRRCDALELEAGESRRKLSDCVEELARVNASSTEASTKFSTLLQSVREGFDAEQRNYRSQIEALRTELEQTRSYARDQQAAAEERELSTERAQAELKSNFSSLQLAERTKKELESELTALQARYTTQSAMLTDTEQRAVRAEAALQRTESRLAALEDSLARAQREKDIALSEVWGSFHFSLGSCSAKLTRREKRSYVHT